MQRQTIQKQIILDTLGKMKERQGHFSVDEIYSVIKQEFSSISKTTIYRNVRQLAEIGVLKRIILEDGLERYDTNTSDHYHFMCVTCSEIFDVEIEEQSKILNEITQKYDFDLIRSNLSFSGTCSKCKKLQGT